MWAQNVSVGGVITDETGAPMPGVAIALQGSTRGVTTDPDGTYKIEVPQDATLVISFLGYETQTIAVNGQRKIDVQLKPKGDLLDEVTVVAFGTQKKSSIDNLNVLGPISLVNSGNWGIFLWVNHPPIYMRLPSGMHKLKWHMVQEHNFGGFRFTYVAP
ncbi:hypothetical protein FACS1894199_11990 [Bacteroidia bacterium]|nr:hypothetical protein FACS1894199_11990 [Bacteroidia bacterium]